jgi:hypothetical protein
MRNLNILFTSLAKAGEGMFDFVYSISRMVMHDCSAMPECRNRERTETFCNKQDDHGAANRIVLRLVTTDTSTK